MRAIPSPTWRTVPTSERSVSTSNCSIRCLRIDVISSGLSFTSAPCGRQFVSKSVEAAADAGVDAQRPGLKDDAADQAPVDGASGLDGAPGGLLDLANEVLRLRVAELDRRCQLDVEDA